MLKSRQNSRGGREAYVTAIVHEARLERLGAQYRDLKAARKQAILEAHQAGVPMSRIAQALGVSKALIGQITLKAKRGLDRTLGSV